MSEAASRTQVPPEVRALAGLWKAEEETLCVFHIPFDPNPGSTNRSGSRHWSKRAERDEVAATAAMWAYQEAEEPKLQPPLVVDVLCMRARVMDDDNLRSGLKHVRDVIFRRAVGDDAPKWLTFRNVKQVTGDRFAGPRAWTVFIVRRRSEG
jgi:hypothetical protein